MRQLVALLMASGLSCPPCHSEEPPPAVRLAGARELWSRYEVTLSTGVSALSIDASTFRDACADCGSLPPRSGATYGYHRPWVWTLGGSLLYFPIPYLALGAYFGGAVGLQDRGPVDADVAGLIGSGDLSVIYVGPEIYGVIPIGRVSLRLGGRLGLRSTRVSASGPISSCDESGFECSASVAANEFFAAPEVAAFYKIGRVFVVGGFAGIEITLADARAPGLVLGLTFGVNGPPPHEAR